MTPTLNTVITKAQSGDGDIIHRHVVQAYTSGDCGYPMTGQESCAKLTVVVVS